MKLVLCVRPICSRVCEPDLTVGIRLDRGSQPMERVVWQTLPVPATSRLQGAGGEGTTVLDMLPWQEAARISSDEESGTHSGVEQAKSAAIQIYQQWIARDPSKHHWFAVDVPMAENKESILHRTLNLSLYTFGLAPLDEGRVGCLTQRRIDHVTLSLGLLYDFARSRPDGAVFQLGKDRKLAVGLHMAHSQVDGTSLSKALASCSAEDAARYKQTMRQAQDMSFRRAKLANLQYYSIHCTRRFLGAEQSLRKFNGSYFLSTNGEPLPGERWVAMQSQNLSVWDRDTLLAMLRVSLAAEGVTYTPAQCASPAHKRLMAKRLAVCMATLPSRSVAYMADVIDRCMPDHDEEDKSEPALGAGTAAGAARHCSSKTMDLQKFHGKGVRRPHAAHQEATGRSTALQKHHATGASRGPRHSRGHAAPRPHRRPGFLTFHPGASRVVRFAPYTPFQGSVLHELLSFPSAFAGKARASHAPALASLRASKTQRHKTLPAPRSKECHFLRPELSLPPDGGSTQDHLVLPLDWAQQCFSRLLPTLRQTHVMEDVDEYDGMFDCPYPAVTCNDCESESTVSGIRNGQTLCLSVAQLPGPAATGEAAGSSTTMATLETMWLDAVAELLAEDETEAVNIVCAISMGAMADGGKRGSDFAEHARGGLSQEAFRRNCNREITLEQGAGLTRLPPLEKEEDEGGTSWSWWPEAESLQRGLTYLSPGGPASPTTSSWWGNWLWSENKSAGTLPRLYKGDRTRDSPELGCHVCGGFVDWSALYAMAVRGIVVERYVQETQRPIDADLATSLMEKWARVRLTGEHDRQQDMRLDPAWMLMESTEFSHPLQMGDEVDGQGRSLDDPAETQFYRHFRKTFGSRASLFLFRLPLHNVKNYDMYHSAMEISSVRLQRVFGCGNWSLYDLATGRHALDFRQLFRYSVHDILHGPGVSLVLRPTTPLMDADAARAMQQTLWPLERLMPAPPRIPSASENTTSLPPDLPVFSLDKTVASKHFLFVNHVRWVCRDATFGNQTLQEAFEAWARQYKIQVQTSVVRVHAFLDLVVLECESSMR